MYYNVLNATAHLYYTTIMYLHNFSTSQVHANIHCLKKFPYINIGKILPVWRDSTL